jgi:Spy/CpxP family protein refolding chaperone
MFRGKLMACILVGAVSTVAVTAPVAVGRLGDGRFANTPLGRVITGNLGRWMVLRSELDLSNQQRELIRAVVVLHRSEVLTVARDVWQQRTALREQVLAAEPDEAAIRAAADELGKAIGDASVLASQIASEARTVLSEDQIEMIGQCQADCDDAVARFFEKAMTSE